MVCGRDLVIIKFNINFQLLTLDLGFKTLTSLVEGLSKLQLTYRSPVTDGQSIFFDVGARYHEIVLVYNMKLNI